MTKDLWLQMDGIGTKWFFFQNIIRQITRINRNELGHFLPFFKIQSQGIELTKTLLFIFNFFWSSNNLMQKWLLQPLLSIKLSIWKYFSHFFCRNFDHYKGFRQSFLMIGPFTAIPSLDWLAVLGIEKSSLCRHWYPERGHFYIT